MKKTLINLVFVSLIFILPACNLPKKTQPSADTIATQVAVVLTSIPTATTTTKPTVLNTTAPLSTATQPITPSETAILTTSTSIASTLTVTNTATELASATTTATTSPTDPKANLGKATWERSTFSDGKEFGSFDSPETGVTIKNSMLVLTAKKADKFLGWTLSYPRPQNYYIEATVTTSDCSGADQYGLVLRASDYDQSKGYFVGFTCDGRYELNKWDGTNMDNIFPWSGATGLNPGSNQTNQLGVMLNGDKISIYANGNLVKEVNDSTYPDAGYYGLFIASENTVGFNIQLSKIAYWDLK